MDQDDPVIAGYLLFPPHGNVLNKITKKKPWAHKYCMLFKSSKQGIERLEVYENKEDVTACACQRIITLENCIKITHTNPNTITIVTKSATQLLSGVNDGDSVEWVKALQAVAFREGVGQQDSIDEDNDLYCTSGEGVFSVNLCSSEASARCSFEPGNYILLITSTAIELRGAGDSRLCAVWPYRYIRRYGYRQGKFAFEAGRKCETGEGTFHFEHSNQQEIFRCLSMKIKYMKKMINGESLHSLDCGDQFQAALSMEARSRSPLPLSVRSEDLSFNPISIKSSSTLHLSPDAPPSLSSSKHSKPKPVKPPRKHIFLTAKERHEKDFVDQNIQLGKYKKLNGEQSNVSPPPATSYDNVEVRSEAWKTLGITDIRHVECAPQVTHKSNQKAMSKSQDNLDSLGSKIIAFQSLATDPEDANYDRLQHFRSTNKLNSYDGYKSIQARPQATQNNNAPTDTWNDYDLVENNMQSVRLADDSYLGYGMIRKPSVPGPQVPNKNKSPTADENLPMSDVNLGTFDSSKFTIVSEPKRV